MRYSAVTLFRYSSLFLLYAIISGGPAHALAGETVRINGSGTGLEMMKPLIKAYAEYDPGISFEMEKPLAIVAGSNVPVENISTEELEAIYSGRSGYLARTSLESAGFRSNRLSGDENILDTITGQVIPKNLKQFIKVA